MLSGICCNQPVSSKERMTNFPGTSCGYLFDDNNSAVEKYKKYGAGAGRFFNNPKLLEINLNTDPNQVSQLFTYDSDDWFGIMLSIKGRSFPWRPWCIVMFITMLYVLVDTKYGLMIFGDFFDKDINSVVHATFCIVLGFLLAWQSGQSNARWWEARVAWQNMMSNSREAMRLICCHCNGKEFLKLFGRYVIAFTVCGKNYLLCEKFTEINPCPELAQILEPDDLRRLYLMSSRNRPLACLYALQRMTEVAVKKTLIPRPVTRDISPRFVTLANNLGACERILFTPMPWVYTLHLRIFMVLYLACLPFALSYYRPVPPISAILFYVFVISYAFLGLEDMAVQIQNPFGNSVSDHSLTVFLQLIQNDIEEIFRMKYGQYNKSFTGKLEGSVYNSKIRLELGMENKPLDAEDDS